MRDTGQSTHTYERKRDTQLDTKTETEREREEDRQTDRHREIQGDRRGGEGTKRQTERPVDSSQLVIGG